MESSRSDVVSIGRRGSFQPKFNSLASQRLRSARKNLGMARGEFASLLTGMVGWKVTEAALANLEQRSTPPGDLLLAAAAADGGPLAMSPGDSLDPVPLGFAPDALAGDWVTVYQFSHGGRPHHHADIAHVTASGGGLLRAVNHPPEPRTEGRSRAFRNEITARLAGRHLVGTWRNTSDARYFGSVHLAILPGETVMEGWYTGLATDVEVSVNRWKWVRLDAGSVPAETVARVVLRDPSAVYESVMTHQFDAPMALGDIGEVA